MKGKFKELEPEELAPLTYLLVALLAGGFGYRACNSGRGFGNFPGNVWLAGIGTTAITFVILMIAAEAMSPRAKLWICAGLVLLALLVHAVAF